MLITFHGSSSTAIVAFLLCVIIQSLSWIIANLLTGRADRERSPKLPNENPRSQPQEGRSQSSGGQQSKKSEQQLKDELEEGMAAYQNQFAIDKIMLEDHVTDLQRQNHDEIMGRKVDMDALAAQARGIGTRPSRKRKSKSSDLVNDLNPSYTKPKNPRRRS
jgi:hypothetical protein